MKTGPVDITGQRQLLMDPRVVAESDNVLPSLAEARKLGKVIEQDPRLVGRATYEYSSALWDPERRKVRLYYTVSLTNEYCLPALAESEDGVHFTRPALGVESFEGSTQNNFVTVGMKLPDIDRMLQVGTASGSVAIDGNLDKPAWQDAAVIDRFLLTESGEISDWGMTVRVMRDDEALYVGVNCPGRGDWPEYETIPEAADEDSIEIFVDPSLDRMQYYHFRANCYGSTFERRDTAPDTPGHAMEWQTAVSRRDDGWSLEARIPLPSLGVTDGNAGCAWGFNIAHSVKTDAGLVCENWTEVGSYWRPQAFGVLAFEEREFSTLHQALWEDVNSGQSLMKSRRGPCVFIDPNGPAAERYKMSWRDAGSFYVAASSDGITFDTRARILDSGSLDTSNIMFWDHLAGKYVAYTRWWHREPSYPERRRSVARMESYRWDGDWSEREVVIDPLDFPCHDGYKDFYTPDVFIYENLYLAMVCVFHRDVAMGPLEPTLMMSIDGVHWKWLGGGSPFLRRSDDGWDSGMISCHPAPVLLGERLYLYYRGHSGQHFEERKDLEQDASGIGAACLRRDGFMCMHGRRAYPATVTTAPLVFRQGDDLVLNVATLGADGEARVEVVGQERFSAEACLPIRDDDTSYRVQWRAARFAELRGEPIRLRFHLNGARLYAFEVVPGPGE